MPEINYNFISLVDFLGLVQGLVLGGVLLIDGWRLQKPKWVLGVFLILYSLELLDPILEDLQLLTQYPQLIFTPFNFHFAVIPVFYLYVQKIAGNKITKSRTLWVLLPGLLEFLLYSILFFQRPTLKLTWYQSDGLMDLLGLLSLLSFPYSIYYSRLTLKFINQHKQSVEDFYSSTQGKSLLWAKTVIYFLLSYLLVLVVLDLFMEIQYADLIGALVNVAFIFWVGIVGIKQQTIFENKAAHLEVNTSKKEEILNLNLKDKLRETQLARLEKLMEAEKIFLEPNLTLSDVAIKLKISQRNLSELINTSTSKNFNHFVNTYRVEEAKKLLLDPTKNHLNILGIAYDSGFSSKASFYSVFKKFTALTPKQFKNSHIKEVF